MQLTFLILVLYCYIHNSSANAPPTGTQWRQSRYIIDNRRNALFSKKLPAVLLHVPPKDFYQVERYQKDLSAEASISEPKFYQNYRENSLPRKIIKTYRLPGDFENDPKDYSAIYEKRKNTTLDPQNFIQTEEDFVNDVVTTTEKIWGAKDVLVSPTTSKHPENPGTTVSYPWGIAKTEQNNQIDNNEKHVYETRIETVSYHQEVIFNPPKKQNWYQEEKPKNYEPPEENYEESEKNYQQPEQGYEEEEKNYEEDEKNYEEDEKNYEEEEKNYEMDMSQGGESQQDNQNKFGYVVEGTNYRKYRVEERTVDGFIVGEYGVVSHDDGSLRGVRYTADGNTNPKLIYETLIKFLSL